MNAPSDTLGAAGLNPADSDFETIFETHYESIARAIVRVIHDNGRAEELAVEAFLKFARNPHVQGERSGGWLRRTAIRLALDELRRRARRARYESLWTWSRVRQPDELLSASQEQGRVRTVLAALSERNAELLLLRHDGASYDELASSLDILPASVGTILSRAQQAFRKEYTRRYGER